MLNYTLLELFQVVAVAVFTGYAAGVILTAVALETTYRRMK